ncbi:MAG: outer membrane beta-barrel protein [Stenotrophobium sp.]
MLGASGVTAGGYLDAGYAANFVAGPGDTNSFSFNQAALTLAMQPTQGFGGLVNVSLGEDAKAINGFYGDNAGNNFALTQAYVQYATGGLTVIGGRYVSEAGSEYIDQTQDANITRSFLFGIQPRVQTGVRASYQINTQVGVFGGVSNAALTSIGIPGLGVTTPLPPPPAVIPNVISVDNNPQKAIEVGVKLAPMSGTSVKLSHYRDTTGTDATPGNRIDVTDLVAELQATQELSFGLNADYWHTPSSAGSTIIKGVALYGSLQFCDQFKGSLRGEYLRVQGGGGSPIIAKELTYTVDYTAAKNFNLLAEYRYNRATAGAGKVIGSNVGVKAIYSF